MFPETSVAFQRTTQRYIAVDSSLHNHRCENLNSYIMLQILAVNNVHFLLKIRYKTGFPVLGLRLSTLCSCELTPWSWDLLEKSPVAQPFKNFPTFYGIRWFSAVFIRASDGPYPEPDQSSPYHSILAKIHFNIILHLILDLSSGLPPSSFPTKFLHASPSPHACYIPCPSHPH
jgi:hypothetical protein